MILLNSLNLNNLLCSRCPNININRVFFTSSWSVSSSNIGNGGNGGDKIKWLFYLTTFLLAYLFTVNPNGWGSKISSYILKELLPLLFSFIPIFLYCLSWVYISLYIYGLLCTFISHFTGRQSYFILFVERYFDLKDPIDSLVINFLLILSFIIIFVTSF